jgi:hypothetical protein
MKCIMHRTTWYLRGYTRIENEPSEPNFTTLSVWPMIYKTHTNAQLHPFRVHIASRHIFERNFVPQPRQYCIRTPL